MKTFLFIAFCMILLFTPLTKSFAQGVSINTDNSAPDASSILDVKSTTSGMLIPRMTSAQRTGIATPATGLLVYDTDTQSFWFRDATVWKNLLSGTSGWSLSGNVAGSSDFMGTTNNQSLLFKANNLQAGKIDLPLSNTFWGSGAGTSNTSGSNNTANGKNALSSNTTGDQNIAIGTTSLFSNSTGYNNTAIGVSSLFSNTTGYRNTANGAYALYSNTTGTLNTACGEEALYSNSTGFRNSAIGRYALFANTTGFNNTGIGEEALFSNTTGSGNTANGMVSLLSNNSGSSNTVNGSGSMYSNT
ncbi:MAG: hypothetical protein WBP41_00595, partial [Saprospiraceae bacterium]